LTAPDVTSAAPAPERPLLVTDVDAAAVTAKRLQGAIVAGPFDIPIGRTAVLADPAGATFSVTQINRAR
jgi:predicted enzyme related to lactoylglutathione lyase